MQNGKRWMTRLLCMALAAMLCACNSPKEEISDMVLTETMPKTEDERDYPYFEAELYFASADNRRLMPETRRVIMAADGSHIEAAVRALFDGASTQSQQSVLQNGLSYEKMELSTGVCNVYISGTAALDEKQWLITRAAVAATVNAVDGTPSVNLYYNQMEPGYLGRPLGALSPIIENLDVYVRNMELEYEAIKKEIEEGVAESSFEMRNATLYFIDNGDDLLMAQNIMLSYDAKTSTEGIAGSLIGALGVMPENANGLKLAIPDDFELAMVESPIQYIADAVATDEAPPLNDAEDSAGDAQQANENTGILEIRINQLARGFDEEKMCGAVTMTLTGFLPGIRGVYIIMQDENGESRVLNGGKLCTREMFSETIGHTITLDYPSENGVGFYTMDYAVAGKSSYALITRLEALLDKAEEMGNVFPGFDKSDIQNVYITGNTAVVNWNKGFAAKLKAMQENEQCPLPEERRIWLFAYSVINTMSEFPGVQKVWMLENGQKLGTQGGIYLGNALMRNPGAFLETRAE